MSRSGYYDDIDHWQLIRWRGAVKSAVRGKRGQAMLKEMLAALDAMPEKKLVSNILQDEYDANCVCALGALGRSRGMDMSQLDPEDRETVAAKFDVAHALACEIMWENDEGAGYRSKETPEQRFVRVRKWVIGKLAESSPREAGE